MAQSVTDQERIGDALPPRRGRRKLVVLTLFCLLLVVVLSIVWSGDRPLTGVEQRLVGTWRTTSGPVVFTFHPDRTITSPGHPRGVWRVYDHTLYTADSACMHAVETLLDRHLDPPLELAFEDDDHISVVISGNRGTHQWQRVSDQSAAEALP